MALSVKAGVPKRSLYGDIVSRVNEAVSRGEEVLWLTPSYHAAKRVSRELLNDIPYGVDTTTLGALFESLWGLYGGGEKIVDGVVREVFITQTFERHEWRYLTHPPLSTSGLKEALETICPLVVDPETLTACNAPEREIKDLIVEYFGIIGETEFLEKRQALEALDLPATKEALVVIDGFTTLSTFDLRLVEKLSACSNVVCLFEWAADYPQTAVSTETIQKLEEMGAEVEYAPIAPARGEIEEVARALWCDLGVVKKKGRVWFAEAAGEGLEPVLVLSQVWELLGQEERFEPCDIAIVHPQLGLTYKKFVEVAEQRGIPLVVDMALSFGETTFGKAFMALVALVSGSGDRTTALTFLRSPYSGIEPAVAYQLDERWREKRIEEPHRILSSLLGVSGELPFLVKEVQAAQRGTVGGDWAKRWERVGSRFLANAKSHHERYGSGGRAIDPFDAAAHTALIDALEAGAAIGEDLSGELFFEALKRTRVSTGEKDGAQAVVLTEPARIAGREIPALIVAGLSSQEFPSGSDESFASALMSSFSLAPEEQRGAVQRNLFYSLVAAAKERLVLSRTSMSLDGSEVASSPFYEDVRTLYQKPFEYDSDEAREATPPTVTLGFSRLEEVAGRYSDARVKLRKAVLDGEQAIAIKDRGAKKVVALGEEYETRPFSASTLETYLACPYRWFYSRVLNAREIDSQFDNRERGSAAHRVLERFYRRVMDEVPEGRVTLENLPDMYVLLDEEFDREQTERGESRTPEERLGFESLRHQLHRLIEHDSRIFEGLKPAAVEWAFGKGEEGALDVEGIPMQGMVDRVDVSEFGAALFDYKSGAAPGRTDIINQSRVQAVLYARAVKSEFGKDVVASLYRSIRSGKAEGLELKDAIPEKISSKPAAKQEQWDEAFFEITRRAKEAAANIKEGKIAPNPNPKDTRVCELCDARIICEGARS